VRAGQIPGQSYRVAHAGISQIHKMKAHALLRQAKQRGMRIEMFRGRLSVVRPSGACPEFVEKLRAHKIELLAWFAADHLCKQIQCGEFDGCDRRTVKKIIAILQASKHSSARRAIEHLLQDV
jgi:hypothetical protein